MTLLKKDEETVLLKISCDEIRFIHQALIVPLYAFHTPDFEEKVGFSEVEVKVIEERLSKILADRPDYDEYHKLALKLDNEAKASNYFVDLNLSLKELVLINNAFRESCDVIVKRDEIHTLTGHTIEEAQALEKQLQAIVKEVEHEFKRN